MSVEVVVPSGDDAVIVADHEPEYVPAHPTQSTPLAAALGAPTIATTAAATATTLRYHRPRGIGER
ncbi:MAG TPA: hypothetical protein VMA96_01060 [Solirubrobacteraceae bacterium]|nr:hypothetical protein [Solirubrobacteraceae bacterium]